MSFWKNFKLLAAIYIFTGLLAGYWDTRLSNLYIYHDQISKIHLYRTLQAHVVLGVLIALILAAWILFMNRSSKSEFERSRFIANHIALTVSSLVFIIFFIKTHLLWLKTHLFELQGFLWTFVIVASCVLLYFIVRFLVMKVTSRPSSKQLAAGIFLVCCLGTFADEYFHRRFQLPETPSTTKPNILLIVVDTLRWDFITSYGYPRKITPNLEALTRESVLV